MRKIQEILKEHYINYSSRRFNTLIEDETDDYFKLRFLLFYNDLNHINIKGQKTFEEYLKATPDELLKIIEHSLYNSNIHSSVWMEDRTFHKVDNKLLDLSNYREILKIVLCKDKVNEALHNDDKFLLLNRVAEFNNTIFKEEFINNYDPDKFNEFLATMIPKDHVLKFVDKIMINGDESEEPHYAVYESGDIFNFEGDNFLKFMSKNFVGEDSHLTLKRNFGDINSRNTVKNDFLINRALECGLNNETIVELSYQLFNARPGLYDFEQLEYFIESFDENMPIGWQIEMA